MLTATDADQNQYSLKCLAPSASPSACDLQSVHSCGHLLHPADSCGFSPNLSRVVWDGIPAEAHLV